MLRDVLHLKAPGNWLNDPNGFIYYKGKYHVFFQQFPYAPVWGTMHWGHAVSEDLIHWEHRKTAVFPTKDYDRDGVFSGSGIEKDGKLYLYYSAVRYEAEDEENIHLAKDGRFVTSQAMLISDDGEQFDNFAGKKQIIPVSRDSRTADARNTRDPKVWRDKEHFYMILGSTLNDRTGRVLFYKSKDAQKWEYAGQYQNDAYGTVIECPDLFETDGAWVFAGCPMGIMNDGLAYADQAVCALADFREEDCRLKLPETYQFIDYGLDLYAPQTNVDAEGRRVMIAWMRMPEPVVSGEDERGEWIGMMCLPRVVEVSDGHIYFRVHPQVKQHFTSVVSPGDEADFKEPFYVRAVLEEERGLDIGGYRIWAEDGCIRTDRSRVFRGLEGYRTTCCTPPLKGGCKLDIFVEPNLIEVFVNDGEYVISNIVYGLDGTMIKEM
ncbi:glycoside hydrolase family 32 protein [[Clostridium] hylemonae]|uniref:glycoside hydrolase family 32 protein n=1 Tax=[Clostridium] hylemonae TaxID=89153 RepID=UPI001D05DB5B|nr:glycoside hydrolase family 32 protein [[Clostridium] hylemonae]MCB7520827.1 glycoside hydrolase family 32 protein [[Clostridium] hylemonae]